MEIAQKARREEKEIWKESLFLFQTTLSLKESNNNVMESPRHLCLKLELPNPTEPGKIETIFIKATWYDTHFELSITNGPDS
ncbi:hypothetical protein CDL15_Pgr016369 [Punica granatum]|uniref:Uncharacterized protein n=1 Tax=Punica granatum TaxID=22663 RepID=A0A218W6N4_PUNGR|nr:hypothetical protein CDL15_Pgr016369 [Punica granatum]